ncbi:Hok/Gef family protein [Kalamiella sp. sgz302252]|uniref:Hok/Gef family protein n=1 Tax=Pantoea sp. sgz302252 TaxID=3341827 RepID=UPI0036D3579F
MKALKLLFLRQLIFCITVLLFTWMTHGSLCGFYIKHGGTEVIASLACESGR